MSPSYRPRLDTSEIPALVKSLYGLDVTVVKELDSYVDQNFHVQLVSDPAMPIPSEDVCATSLPSYVLKVMNSLDSREPELIEAQTQMMLHAKCVAFPCPGPVLSLDHTYQTLVDVQVSHPEGPRNEKCVVRLLEFMPGLILNEVPLTAVLCYEVGSFAGRLDSILKSFPLYKYRRLTQMTQTWSLIFVPRLVSRIHVLLDPEQVKFCLEIIQEFEVKVVQCQDKFLKGLIHYDINDCNIVVSTDKDSLKNGLNNDTDPRKAGVSLKIPSHIQTLGNPTKDVLNFPEKTTFHVSGLIDFGDAKFSFYIFEIAVAIAHVMIKPCGMNPLHIASCVLAGYLQHMHLPHDELKVLKLSICARLVQLLVMGYATILEDPENEYVLVFARKAWPVLKILWAMPDEQFLCQVQAYD